MTQGGYVAVMDLIEEKNIPLYSIADKLGLKSMVLSLKLNKEGGFDLTYSEAVKIAEMLGVTLDDFF